MNTKQTLRGSCDAWTCIITQRRISPSAALLCLEIVLPFDKVVYPSVSCPHMSRERRTDLCILVQRVCRIITRLLILYIILIVIKHNEKTQIENALKIWCLFFFFFGAACSSVTQQNFASLGRVKAWSVFLCSPVWHKVFFAHVWIRTHCDTFISTRERIFYLSRKKNKLQIRCCSNNKHWTNFSLSHQGLCKLHPPNCSSRSASVSRDILYGIYSPWGIQIPYIKKKQPV